MKQILTIIFLLFTAIGLEFFGQNTTTFNTAGGHIWVCPAGVTSLQVEAWGGGAGGRTSINTNNHCGGGGGGGAYARRNAITVVPGTTYNFTVGAGGGANTAGNQSTATVNGVTITAVGGSAPGASGTPGTGGNGGTAAASVGDVKFSGGNGANGSNSGGNNGTGGGGGGGAGSTANGANGTLQTGGVTTANNGGAGGNGGVNANGGAAPVGGFGGGGGGAGHKNNTGGAGRAGAIVLTYSCPVVSPSAGSDQVLASCATSTSVTGSAIPVSMTGTWTVVSGTATIATPNSATTNITNIPLGTTVVLRWTISNGECGTVADDMTVTTSQGPGCLTYCAPSSFVCPFTFGGNSYYPVITNTTLGTLNNNSPANACAVNSYQDFTAVAPPTLLIGSIYNLSISVGSDPGDHVAGVWIDFNANGNLMDAGEYFEIGTAIQPNTTVTIPITIPTGAVEGVTRMRIRYAYGTVLLSSYACLMGNTYGETEDYSVNIQCSTLPSDVTGRFPANTLALACGSAATLIWDYHRCADGYKVYLGTNNPPNTLVSTQGQNDLDYFTGNLASNTTYYWRIVPYNGSGDGASSTWSFTTQTAINTAISQDEDDCGESGITLIASGGAFPDYFWYTVPNGGTPIHSGDTYIPVGLTDPTTFYVSNVLVGPAASIQAGTTSTVVCSGTERGWGTMFDVQAKSANLTITGADVMFRNLGTGGNSNRPVRVYYRTNSFQGNAGSPAGWILVGDYVVNVPNSTTVPIFIDFDDFFVPAGAKYGVYIVYDQEYDPGANVFSNADVEIITGTSVCTSEFGNVINDRTFRGTVYYETSCSSPTVAVLATPYVSNNEVTLALNTVIAAEEQCEEAGWTYYADPLDPLEWLFAINKNGNNFTATVDIIETPTTYSNINASSPHGSFLMSRYWNVNITSGSIVAPVGARFFFDTAEIRDAFDLRNFERTTNYPTANDVDWRWFKTVGAPFDPSIGIDGNIFNFNNITPNSVNNFALEGAPYTGFINDVAYVEFNGLTSFSGGTGGFGFSVWDNVVLSVELLNFKGKPEQNYNHITWETASETNNDYFILESSSDGVNFDAITTIQGVGNSSHTISYQFKDFDFYSQTFYRLIQVDYDGEEHKSQVVVVNRYNDLNDLDIVLYPNPSNGEVNLKTYLENPGEVNVRVLNLLGELIYNEKINLKVGYNNNTFDFSNLANGIYKIEFQNQHSRKVVQFVKQ